MDGLNMQQLNHETEVMKHRQEAEQEINRQNQLYQEIHKTAPEEALDGYNEYQQKVRNMKDTAQLGRKSFKFVNKEKRKKNNMIARSQALTSKATAYTENVFLTLQWVKNIDKQEYEQMSLESVVRKMQNLANYRFTPQMFESSNIRSNLQEYLMLIHDYDHVTEYMENIGTDSHSENMSQEQRLREMGKLNYWKIYLRDNVSEIMDLFRHRLRVYCEQNRVELDGTILKEKDKPAQLTKEQINEWYEKTIFQSGKRVIQYESELKGVRPLSLEEINEKKETGKLSIQPHDLLVSNRYLYAEQIAEQAEKIKKLREDLQNNGQQDLSEDLLMTEQDYQAHQLLAGLEREYMISRLKNHPEAEQKTLLDRCKRMYEDLQRLERRRVKLERGMSYAEGNAAEETKTRKRSEAITTYSDLLSQESRMRLMEICEKTKPSDMSEDVLKTVKNYIIGNRYQVGYTKERELLKDAVRSVKKEREKRKGSGKTTGACDEILQYFEELTNGTLEIPAGTAAEDIIDFSTREPEEIGSMERGSKRNALIRSLSYWSDQTAEPLFAHEPTVNDLKQRLVSNCYMLASVSGLINFDPAMLKSCIKDEGDTVVVRLYEKRTIKNAAADQEAEESKGLLDQNELGDVEIFDVDKIEFHPVYVRVKKTVPRIAGADALSAGALWMQMIEKACACLGKSENQKGYHTLWYGTAGQFFERLLGRQADYVDKRDKTDELFKEILSARKDGYVYDAGSKGNVGEADGLNSGHAYTVLGAKEINNVKYVILRNPYSNGSMQYNRDGSKTRTGFGVASDETYGQFYMEINEFAQKFTVKKNRVADL